TDGDIRRGFEKGSKEIFDKPAQILMTRNPRWVDQELLVLDALTVMEDHSITSLFVQASDNPAFPVGIIHIHDILKSGIL
ncbi:MAG: CBS domain-containing protein, partial [Candidatus Neomarinimicrobiota bacterium]